MSVLKEYARNKGTIFWLFEGLDAGYFGPRIWQKFSDLSDEACLSFKNCGGKDNVRNLSRIATKNSSLKGAMLVYCIDRDFDWNIDTLPSKSFYVTDGYSVENYYTSVSCFEKIVRNAFFGNKVYDDKDEECISNLVVLFRDLQAKFHLAIELFNLWALSLSERRLVPIGLSNFRSLDDVELVRVDLSDVTQNYDLAYLNKRFSDREAVTDEHLSVAKRWFEQKSVRLAFRGKQEIRFLAKLLSLLRDCSTAGREPFHIKLKCSLQLSSRDIVAELSAFADTPDSLLKFISRQRRRWLARRGRLRV